ncbi:MAG: hypothetical protein ACKOYJ_05635 [Planctomycetia bacterium]
MSSSRQPHGEPVASRVVPSPAGAVLLRPLVHEIVNLTATTLPERFAADAPLIVVDVDGRHAVAVEPGALRRVLATLVHDAVVAAAGQMATSDVPGLREVVITSICTSDAIEIEVADSSSAAPDAIGMAAGSARSIVERLGGSLQIHRCAEGGRAVTLSFPRSAAGQSVGGGLRRAA